MLKRALIWDDYSSLALIASLWVHCECVSGCRSPTRQSARAAFSKVWDGSSGHCLLHAGGRGSRAQRRLRQRIVAVGSFQLTQNPHTHTPAVSAAVTRQRCGDIPHEASFALCCWAWLWLTRLRRWSEASVLEDLEVFIAEEMVLEEVWVREPCLARSWTPGLGSPALVAPVFIMAARHGQNLWFDRYYRVENRNCCLTKIGWFMQTFVDKTKKPLDWLLRTGSKKKLCLLSRMGEERKYR